ncbi:serine/threonine-protein phosphatase 4 regulatory subunit 2-B isoform X1 [Anguilla anguilla]|uniref:serine/threonine-protein phosphatase 4 regulatory subunit 2-B isoform X1 n=1 Tax=Anguilla anguilla TaxID=7936 RepID=UPI0015B084AB|nr:serine/threonine-protein phosphatase 4 regulatory subunit 2-B isoform X1 [Anguilla anguilla]
MDRENTTNMEIDTLLEALKDFDKKGKKDVCPVLDQFLCHVAKTGETMIQWSQFKSYFLFKLEKVMDDFRASAPEQRGPANPNVECIPFEEMKERILKIVNGYNGIPFTIQRLCELLTEPRRNYTGTDKFLRGVEKNVMVVSCVYPTSEKNGSTTVNRMNGVMFPGNSSTYSDRNVNGPGTPRPLNRPKLSLSSSLATNGLPDSTENKAPATEMGDGSPLSDSSVSEGDGTPGGPLKNKHQEDEDAMEAEQHEVKRLKFDRDDEDEDDDEEEEGGKEAACPAQAESSSEMPEEAESSSDVREEGEKNSEAASSVTSEDQEPSSTQTEPSSGGSREEEEAAEREVSSASAEAAAQEEGGEMDQSQQPAPADSSPSPEAQEGSEAGDPVSSSSSSSSEDSASGEPGSSSSTPESAAEGAAESGTHVADTCEEPMEQD